MCVADWRGAGLTRRRAARDPPSGAGAPFNDVRDRGGHGRIYLAEWANKVRAVGMPGVTEAEPGELNPRFACAATLPLWQDPSRQQFGCLSTLFELLHNVLKRMQSIRQGGRPRLQDNRRLDFVERAVSDGRYLCEPRSGCHLLGPKFLAAPRADDDVRPAGNDLLRRNDPLLCQLASLLDRRKCRCLPRPRSVPTPTAMPEIIGSSHSSKYTSGRRGNCMASRCASARSGFQLSCEPIGSLGRTHQRAEHADHVENLRDSALVESVNGNTLSGSARRRCRPGDRKSS